MSLEVLFRVYNDASRDIDPATAAASTVPLNDPTTVPATSLGWVGGMAVRAFNDPLSPQGNGLFFGPGVDANGFPAQQPAQVGTVAGYAKTNGLAAPGPVGFLGVAKNDLYVELFGSPASGQNGTVPAGSLTPSKASVEQGGGTHKILPTALPDGSINAPYLYTPAGTPVITDYGIGNVLAIELNTGKWANLAVATALGATGIWEGANASTGPTANVAGFNAAPVRAVVTGLDAQNQALIVKIAS